MRRTGCAICVSAWVAVCVPAVPARGQYWSGPELISAGVTGADYPEIAMGADGGAVAVYSAARASYSQSQVFANRWDGSAWGGSVRLGPGPDSNTSCPAVAMDGHGNAIVAYRIDIDEESHVLAQRWEGAAWGEPVSIEKPGTTIGIIDYIGVAMDSRGRAIAVFVQEGAGARNVCANRWNGTAWEGAVQIDRPDERDSVHPRISMNADGKAIVVFSQNDGSTFRPCANIWNGAAWEGAARLNAAEDCDAYASDAAMAGNGTAFAVFEQNTHHDGRYDICANRWNGAAWEGSARLNRGDELCAWEPRVEVDGGDAIVLFLCSMYGIGPYQSVWRAQGGSWTQAQPMQTVFTRTDRFEFAVDGSRTGVSVNEEYDGDWPVRVSADCWRPDRWRGAELIDAGTGYNACSARVAMDGGGNAIAVFRENGIYANRFILPNYLELEASPPAVPLGGTVTLSWNCNFGWWDYRSTPVDVYLVAIKNPSVAGRPATVEEALRGGEVWIFENGLGSPRRYEGGAAGPAWSGVVFSPSLERGTMALNVPSSPEFAGRWVFAAALYARDAFGGMRPVRDTDGENTEISGPFSVQ